MCADAGGIPKSEAPSSAADLVELVRQAKGGRASPQDVFDAFSAARFYCERPEEPGFLAVAAPEGMAGSLRTRSRSRLLDLIEAPSEETAPPARLLPVFSSLEQFALFAGGVGGDWFSTTGADLLSLLPSGLDVWLDPAAEHAVRLSSAATGVEPVLRLSYRSGGSAA